MTTKSLLDLTPTQAKNFFLLNESYVSFNLPKYFDFEPVLRATASELEKDKNYIKDGSEPRKEFYELYMNKNNGLDWRSLKILNPINYVEMVLKVTEEENWTALKDFLKTNCPKNIVCTSMPKVPNYYTSQKATSIIDWLQNTESEALKMSLKYEYLVTTDISNCYDSLYTHLLPRSLNGDLNSKCPTNKSLDKDVSSNPKYVLQKLGNDLDTSLRQLNEGKTIGIPQGNIVSDFLAEIVLYGIDKELETRIEAIEVDMDYRILRYRDDYRIFCNTREDIDKICKELTMLLAEFGLKLNTEKTVVNTDLVDSAIKDDKWYRLTQRTHSEILKNEFLTTYKFSGLFPNSGALVTDLYSLRDRLVNETYINREDAEVFIAIASQIFLTNPRCFDIAASIISALMAHTEDNKTEYIEAINKKMEKNVNFEIQEVWLQRMTINHKIPLKTSGKNSLVNIVQKVLNNEGCPCLWEIDHLKLNYRNILQDTSIINEKTLSSIPDVISTKEVRVFERQSL